MLRPGSMAGLGAAVGRAVWQARGRRKYGRGSGPPYCSSSIFKVVCASRACSHSSERRHARSPSREKTASFLQQSICIHARIRLHGAHTQECGLCLYARERSRIVRRMFLAWASSSCNDITWYGTHACGAVRTRNQGGAVKAQLERW